MKLILGSSSPFRKLLLDKLQIDFETVSPAIDESPQDNETPVELVERLSIEKAEAIALTNPNCLIISSDQVAVYDKQILGKPGNKENAIKQLSKFSGQKVQFITGLCVYNSSTKTYQYHQDNTWVNFRSLTANQINNYLLKEEPYQCAGSFRSEGLGCALFKSLETSDPNALIGLPLIKLVELLQNEGLDVLSN